MLVKNIVSEDVTILKKLNDTHNAFQNQKGFESDINLSNYIFYEIEGKINENCF